MNTDQKYWFKRKRYGYGWTPVTWQGWAVVAVYITILIAGALTLESTSDGELGNELGVYGLVVILSTAALLRISYQKAPRPRWQWGNETNDQNRS